MGAAERRILLTGGGVSVLPVAAWNPADTNGSVNLTNSDLTAQGANTTNYNGCRCIAGKTSGKWYFEFMFDTLGVASGCGVAKSTSTLTNSAVYLPSDAVIFEPQGTRLLMFSGGGTSATFNGTLTVNSTVVMGAFDLATGNVWGGFDGTWYNSGDPRTGANPSISGVSYLVGATIHKFFTGKFANKITLNNLPVYTIPTGVSHWSA